MERILNTYLADDHEIDVVESTDEDESRFFLVIDGIIINEGQPFGRVPSEPEARRVASRWWKQRDTPRK